MRKMDVSPSLLISILALFVALSGGAYAALGPHSVGSGQLKPGSVTNRVLHDRSVSQDKLRAGSVGTRQLRTRSVSARKIAGALPGSLVAFGLVTPTGVDAGQSWRIDNSNVTRLPLSVYCLHDLPAHRAAAVTPAEDDASSGAVIANFRMKPLPAGLCGGLVDEKSIEVTTYYSIGDSLTSRKFEPFYIYLYK